LHWARSPSAQREKCAQQPTAAQPQVPGSTNTGWQPVRASQSTSVVASAHVPDVASPRPESGEPASTGGQTTPVQTPGVHEPVPGVQPGQKV
jgi:hypothetical protein